GRALCASRVQGRDAWGGQSRSGERIVQTAGGAGQAAPPHHASLPILLEVDSDREACGDREMRTRRQQFYRRLGCVRVSGLHYILPLPGQGPAPEMDLMLYSAEPERQLSKRDLERWLRTVYRDVYSCSFDDPRIVRMLHDVSDPVRLE